MAEQLEFDAVVVGAGPAGASAALALARAGRRVVLVERGPFPGSKNVYGGVVYGRVGTITKSLPKSHKEPTHQARPSDSSDPSRDKPLRDSRSSFFPRPIAC